MNRPTRGSAGRQGSPTLHAGCEQAADWTAPSAVPMQHTCHQHQQCSSAVGEGSLCRKRAKCLQPATLRHHQKLGRTTVQPDGPLPPPIPAVMAGCNKMHQEHPRGASARPMRIAKTGDTRASVGRLSQRVAVSCNPKAKGLLATRHAHRCVGRMQKRTVTVTIARFLFCERTGPFA